MESDPGPNHYARGGRYPGRRVDCASLPSSFVVGVEKSTVARARQERPMIPGPRQKATSNKNQQATKTKQQQKPTSHKNTARSKNQPATKTKQQQTPASNKKQAAAKTSQQHKPTSNKNQPSTQTNQQRKSLSSFGLLPFNRPFALTNYRK